MIHGPHNIKFNVHERLDTLLPLMMETGQVSEIFEIYSQIMRLVAQGHCITLN
jgi:hypothetical protein